MTSNPGTYQEDPEIEKFSILFERVEQAIFRILQVPITKPHLYLVIAFNGVDFLAIITRDSSSSVQAQWKVYCQSFYFPFLLTMTNYRYILEVAHYCNVAMTALVVVLWVKARLKKAEDGQRAAFAQWLILVLRYLVVYLLAMFAYWLQWPYVYALYADYGYPTRTIVALLVTGAISSIVFGSVVGGMADHGGRRTFVLVFVALFALSCLTNRKSVNCSELLWVSKYVFSS